MLKQVLFGFTKIIAKNDARKEPFALQKPEMFLLFLFFKNCVIFFKWIWIVHSSYKITTRNGLSIVHLSEEKVSCIYGLFLKLHKIAMWIHW